jgi:uncharacterized paraquat-inducible protein A
MSVFRVGCPHCSHLHNVSEAPSGTARRCPRCGKNFTYPTPAAPGVAPRFDFSDSARYGPRAQFPTGWIAVIALCAVVLTAESTYWTVRGIQREIALKEAVEKMQKDLDRLNKRPRP